MHQTEIHAKLISIMGDRLSVHIETLKVCVYVCARECVIAVLRFDLILLMIFNTRRSIGARRAMAMSMVICRL